jgi:hypothetical protein
MGRRLMAGLATSFKLEIEFVAGMFVDLTTSLDQSQDATTNVGRASQFDGIQAGNFSCTCYNDSGDLTPDNPLSAYWPNVVEGKRIRYTVTHGATSDVRFLGYITDWAATNLEDGTAAVQITATDGIGRLGQRTLGNTWAESWQHQATLETVDVFQMDDPASSTDFRNAGSGTGTLRVLRNASGLGSSTASVGSSGELLLSGSVQLQSASGIGPVLGLDLGRDLGTNHDFTMAWSTDAQAAAGIDVTLACGFRSDGAQIWRLYLSFSGGKTGLYLYDTLTSTANPQPDGINGDRSWQRARMYWTGSQGFAVYNQAPSGWLTATRLDLTRYVVFGARMDSWKLPGKSYNGPESIEFGAIAARSAIGSFLDWLDPVKLTPASTRIGEIVQDYTGLTLTVNGILNPNVTRTDSAGRSALDCLDEVLGTVGADCWHDYSTNTITVNMPDLARPASSSLTINLGADDDASTALQLVRAAASKPTRVTVSCAFGSAQAIDTVTEAGPPITQRPDSWSSCAGSVSAAQSVASFRLNRSIIARVSQVGVDLVTATADMWAAVFGLTPGKRVTLSGLPPARVGRTTLDSFVAGWIEAHRSDSSRFVFDGIPADVPNDGIWDTSRFAEDAGSMTVTSGTALGTTGSGGTLVVTTAGGHPPLTNTAGDYPLTLDFNGEAVTINSAPASSTSPQTVTVSTRGVAGTVARSHSAGEPIGIWSPAYWAMG